MTIIPKGKDKQGRNVYRVQVSAGNRPDGTRCRLGETVHGSPKDAERAERRLQAEADKGQAVSSMTFAAWVEVYLREAAKRNAASTVAGYRRMLANRIIPAIGSYRLDELQPKHLAAFYRQLGDGKNLRNKEPLSGHSQLKHHRLIHAILREAQYAGILQANPAGSVRAPKMEKADGPHYTESDVKILLTALDTVEMRYQVPVLLMLGAGLRRGEVIALQWEDILFDRGYVIVRHSAEWVGGEQRMKPPKSRHSMATVPISDELVSVLTGWQELQRVLDKESPYICTQAGGKWMTLDHLSHWYADFAKAAKLPHTGVHALRHTYASLLAGSVTLEALRGFMRHHSATVTLANYSHLYTSYDDAARAQISGAMARGLARESATNTTIEANTKGPLSPS